jgi:hypothetical protein
MLIYAEGDATKVYVSCLVFYDELPQEVLVAHPDLLGHLAPKALCLVTHQPYLQTGRRILQQLYTLVFCWGLEVPLVQLVEQVLQVPAPTAGGMPVSILAGDTCCSLPCSPVTLLHAPACAWDHAGQNCWGGVQVSEPAAALQFV